MARKLTAKQKRFAQEYLKTGNATQSVINAGYQVSNRATAEVIGSENLLKPKIGAYLDVHADEASETMLDIMRISKQFAREGRGAGAQYASVAQSTAKDILDRTHGKAVQQIETKSQAVTISINLTDTDAS